MTVSYILGLHPGFGCSYIVDQPGTLSTKAALQAPLAGREAAMHVQHLAAAVLSVYDAQRAPPVPAAVAVVLAACGQHLAAAGTSLRLRLVAIATEQLAYAVHGDAADKPAAAWRTTLLAAEPSACLLGCCGAPCPF